MKTNQMSGVTTYDWHEFAPPMACYPHLFLPSFLLDYQRIDDEIKRTIKRLKTLLCTE